MSWLPSTQKSGQRRQRRVALPISQATKSIIQSDDPKAALEASQLYQERPKIKRPDWYVPGPPTTRRVTYMDETGNSSASGNIAFGAVKGTLRNKYGSRFSFDGVGDCPSRVPSHQGSLNDLGPSIQNHMSRDAHAFTLTSKNRSGQSSTNSAFPKPSLPPFARQIPRSAFFSDNDPSQSEQDSMCVLPDKPPTYEDATEGTSGPPLVKQFIMLEQSYGDSEVTTRWGEMKRGTTAPKGTAVINAPDESILNYIGISGINGRLRSELDEGSIVTTSVKTRTRFKGENENEISHGVHQPQLFDKYLQERYPNQENVRSCEIRLPTNSLYTASQHDVQPESTPWSLNRSVVDTASNWLNQGRSYLNSFKSRCFGPSQATSSSNGTSGKNQSYASSNNISTGESKVNSSPSLYSTGADYLSGACSTASEAVEAGLYDARTWLADTIQEKFVDSLVDNSKKFSQQ